MKRNTHSEFVGVAVLKEEQAAQLALFEEWAALRRWLMFHASHYDWNVEPLHAGNLERLTNIDRIRPRHSVGRSDRPRRDTIRTANAEE